jgi:hypothetical protein
MIKVFIMVVSVLTNDGQLEMKALQVTKCPDAAAFTQSMDKMKTDKLIKEWNAICIPPQANT